VTNRFCRPEKCRYVVQALGFDACVDFVKLI
jgi:NADPH-dependent curcumin reductase CurA